MKLKLRVRGNPVHDGVWVQFPDNFSEHIVPENNPLVVLEYINSTEGEIVTDYIINQNETEIYIVVNCSKFQLHAIIKKDKNVQG